MRQTDKADASHQPFRDFVHRAASASRGSLALPANLVEWNERLKAVGERLTRSFGRVPDAPCPLDPEILGTVVRDGYEIERLTFQSRPGVRVTANLYRPMPQSGPRAAVLSVHGHWAWARIDPHVQARCLGLVKLGYVVLSIDAFGAGERAIEPGPGTYHGGLAGASLWPTGTSLFGLQVYDNRRAVDLLISRPEVDPTRLAITGASGGGNQTLYAGATDERLAAVVPVCGIGTYDSYLTTACCVCEVNIGGANYATTGDLLAMVAPRALLVISATRDAFQFSVGEAARSVARARGRFQLMGQAARIRHVAVDSGHDYNQPMREALYGWLDLWLRGKGDGQPVPEPGIMLEDVESLRCYPKGTPRPAAIMSIPEFARTEGRARLQALSAVPDHSQRWHADAERMRATLRDRILGGFPARTSLDVSRSRRGDCETISMMTEPGIRAQAEIRESGTSETTALILPAAFPSERGRQREEFADRDPEEAKWRKAGFRTLVVGNPRGAGEMAPIAGVADHTVAEWALWIGRPLVGQWVWDIMRWLDYLQSRSTVLVAPGIMMSVPSIIAAALDPRVAAVVTTECLVSFVGTTSRPWSAVPMGVIAPDILEVGDIAQIAALVAPRPLVVTRGAEPEGSTTSKRRLEEAFGFARSIYSLLAARDQLTIGETIDPRVLRLANPI